MPKRWRPRTNRLARGEVGIREKEPAPTLKTFGEDSFLPFVRSTRAEKPNTVRFYKNSVANLSAYSKLADLPLDQINSEIVAGFVARRQLDQVQVSTINRDLATLRRMFHLAIEWGRVKTLLPRIKLLPGENHRERVLSLEEEAAYLDATSQIGHDIEQAYQLALKGIRAVERGQKPRRLGFLDPPRRNHDLVRLRSATRGVLPPEMGELPR